jgi:hypothetical protein
LGNSKVTRLGLWELVQQVAAVVDAWEIEVVERLGEVPKEGEMDSVLVSRQAIDNVLGVIAQALEHSDRL